MATSDDLYSQWQGASSQLPDLIRAGDQSSLTAQINAADNNNKAVTDAQAAELEAAKQTQSYYNNPDNPMLNGMDVSSRMRVGDIDSSTNRQNANALGMYAASKTGSVKDAINAWQQAFQTRLTAAQAAADNLKAAYAAQYQKEQDDRQYALEQQKLAASYASSNQPSAKDTIGATAAAYANKLIGLNPDQLNAWAEQYSGGQLGGQNARDVVYNVMTKTYGPQYADDIKTAVYGIGGTKTTDSSGGYFSGNWYNGARK